MAGKQPECYLVRDWTKVTIDDDGEPTEPDCRVVYGKDIFKVIDEAKRGNIKISVDVIGESLLDWA